MTLYLYGFVAADQPPPPEGVPGVAGRPVRTIELGPLDAVVSDVPDEDFAAEHVRERLRDLDWVSEQGALHERVVTWFVDHAVILPARFLTLYTGTDALREAVRPRVAELADRLEELSGLREWDLKVSWREEVLRRRMGEVSERVAELDRELDDASPGRRYLLERKRDTIVREESSGAARRLANEAMEELSERAADHRRLQAPSGAADRAPVVLNAALLLHREDEEEVRRRAGEIAERLEPLGVDLDFTGPWAPYRFVSVDDDPANGGAP